MAELEKPIATQEELDAVIGERLKRERDKAAESFKDFVSPEDFENKTKELRDTIDTLTREKEDLSGKISAFERTALISKIARENGLSSDAAAFITGADEKELRTSAEALKKLIGNGNRQAPPASLENSTDKGTPKEQALLRLAQKLSR